MTASENYTVTIRCAAEAKPKPVIHWSYNGHPIPGEFYNKF
jgi:hypothetical protein